MKAKEKNSFINSILEVASGGCTCTCHSKSAGDVKHFMPCCDRTYEKFRD